MLYRVFPRREGVAPDEPGGALYVPRAQQGSGRHDQPASYGALYASRSPVAAIAERLHAFRGQDFTNTDLVRMDGTHDALAVLDDAGVDGVVDLDDPRELIRRRLRPSEVARRDRSVTQRMALQVFDEGAPGFSWWSTLEASWTNLTLFAERAIPHLVLEEPGERLTAEHPAMREAAEVLGVRLP